MKPEHYKQIKRSCFYCKHLEFEEEYILDHNLAYTYHCGKHGFKIGNIFSEVSRLHCCEDFDLKEEHQRISLTHLKGNCKMGCKYLVKDIKQGYQHWSESYTCAIDMPDITKTEFNYCRLNKCKHFAKDEDLKDEE